MLSNVMTGLGPLAAACRPSVRVGHALGYAPATGPVDVGVCAHADVAGREPAREDGASTHCPDCGYAERAVCLSVVWKRGPRDCVQPEAEPMALPQSVAFGGIQAYAKY